MTFWLWVLLVGLGVLRRGAVGGAARGRRGDLTV